MIFAPNKRKHCPSRSRRLFANVASILISYIVYAVAYQSSQPASAPIHMLSVQCRVGGASQPAKREKESKAVVD